MKIPYKRFTFIFEAEEEIYLPSYKGSTFRGAFGTQFKKVVCALKKGDCRDCLLKQRCVYAYIFESYSPDEANILGKVNAIPHPFIIEPPEEEKQRYLAGQTFSMGLILIGDAIQYLPYFIYTFGLLGKNGIGRGRGSCQLQKVHTVSPRGDTQSIYRSKTRKVESFSEEYIDLRPSILAIMEENVSDSVHDAPEEITLRFLTPTRLKYDGKLTIDLEFHVFIRQLLRRLFLLRHYHCKKSPADEGYHRMLIDKARTISIKETNLRWHDWERYSRRQDTRMKLGGFVGNIVYTGAISPFSPFIEAGKILHVGKGTSFGLGKYIISYDETATIFGHKGG
ncbi:MAG: CRISPR system precrRNA processing endoribonuclease RAMP protein Cas6 [Candidatus Brocadia sp. AMX2]|uniref:CRISPR-associated protein Cas6 n=1 Tax=Candidatus Brocadia sinica JPN1 TaxID=1197129 RepID=A0ABQ0JTG4_9BACT|nr:MULTISPECIES: CRISPR system precrRNA processing endoribonuclease RAMP protein Cas6 [Brocadia]MBC6931968.1 CRISPR system precrRNA processing endoribonuclease RAMP protein Cas6 [Candidatus Brocadia sp.]MBL1168267.1 CRISPR system precrRNA processing endoribonuclease RAMP protein Cas6 [Candidatus Brocadia sp. AMX1]NOG39959.1 CRISPR system precrRNA processing endoribonuclease RAMP protein Cas6 [Planctomycetota bacterium]GIK12847.1 MAG: CRISPR-associated protein Cas6 [Candidatus Brocadia sinica]K